MPEPVSRSSGRVSIDSTVHELYKQLVMSGNNVEDAPFSTMKDVFMFAAYAGFVRGDWKPLSTGKKEQPFHYSVFTEQDDVPILKAIAIATTDDIQILEDFSKVVEIAEEYANAGIHDIRTHVVEAGGQALWNLVSVISGT